MDERRPVELNRVIPPARSVAAFHDRSGGPRRRGRLSFRRRSCPGERAAPPKAPTAGVCLGTRVRLVLDDFPIGWTSTSEHNCLMNLNSTVSCHGSSSPPLHVLRYPTLVIHLPPRGAPLHPTLCRPPPAAFLAVRVGVQKALLPSTGAAVLPSHLELVSCQSISAC